MLTRDCVVNDACYNNKGYVGKLNITSEKIVNVINGIYENREKSEKFLNMMANVTQPIVNKDEFECSEHENLNEKDRSRKRNF